MCTASSTSISTLFVKLVLIVLVFIASTSYSAESTDRLKVLGTKYTLSGTGSNSRHKRAPGWGKRESQHDKLLGDFDNDIFNRVVAFRPTAYVPKDDLFERIRDNNLDKRAPGWGKRHCSCSEDVHSNNWKVTPVPHWGKRNADVELDDASIEMDRRRKEAGWDKRAPGWGKRAPGWGKRAPGWGKRNYAIDLDTDEADMETGYDSDNNLSVDQELFVKELAKDSADLRTAILPPDFVPAERRAPGWGKRAPGWGKREPGWGKRNYQFDLSGEDVEMAKRAPGWGKRAPGWGKRAPGWGKRAPGWGKRNVETKLEDEELDKRVPVSERRAAVRVRRSSRSLNILGLDSCQELQSLENEFIARMEEMLRNMIQVV